MTSTDPADTAPGPTEPAPAPTCEPGDPSGQGPWPVQHRDDSNMPEPPAHIDPRDDLRSVAKPLDDGTSDTTTAPADQPADRS